MIGARILLLSADIGAFFPGSEDSGQSSLQRRISAQSGFLVSRPETEASFFRPRRIRSREYSQEVSPVAFVFMLLQTGKWHFDTEDECFHGVGPEGMSCSRAKLLRGKQHWSSSNTQKPRPALLLEPDNASFVCAFTCVGCGCASSRARAHARA